MNPEKTISFGIPSSINKARSRHDVPPIDIPNGFTIQNNVVTNKMKSTSKTGLSLLSATKRIAIAIAAKTIMANTAVSFPYLNNVAYLLSSTFILYWYNYSISSTKILIIFVSPHIFAIFRAGRKAKELWNFIKGKCIEQHTERGTVPLNSKAHN